MSTAIGALPAFRRRCLVTGTSGYVGRELALALRTLGWQITHCNRRSLDPGDQRFDLREPVNPNLFANQDALVHCAYDFTETSKRGIWAVNVAGSQRLFQAARTAGIQRMVNISSISAFDHARSLYGQAKYVIEGIAKRCGASNIRPGLVYGGGSGGMYGRIEAQASACAVVPIVSFGYFPQYLVHVADLVDAVVRLLHRVPSSEPLTVTLANQRPWTLGELTKAIAATQSRKPILLPVPWIAVWAALRGAEAIGLKPKFKSDSVISLVYQNPSPDFNAPALLGIEPRTFAPPLSPGKQSLV